MSTFSFETSGDIGWINNSVWNRLKLLICKYVSLLKGTPKKTQTVKKKKMNKQIDNHIMNAMRNPEWAEQVKVGVWLESSTDIKSSQTIKSFQPCATLLAVEKRQRELDWLTRREIKHGFKNFIKNKKVRISFA